MFHRSLLEDVLTCAQLHGRLVQVLRLLEASGPLSAADHSLRAYSIAAQTC